MDLSRLNFWGIKKAEKAVVWFLDLQCKHVCGFLRPTANRPICLSKTLRSIPQIHWIPHRGKKKSARCADLRKFKRNQSEKFGEKSSTHATGVWMDTCTPPRIPFFDSCGRISAAARI